MAGLVGNYISGEDLIPSLAEATDLTQPTALTYFYDKSVSDSVESDDFQTYNGVRRPLRNVQLKEDTYATISIVDNEHNLSQDWTYLRNSSEASDSSFTANFMLQNVTESRQEKHQVVDTFGKDYIYFFGQRPRQVSFTAVLMNAENFRWEEEWWVNYDNVMRGTKLVSNRLQVRIRFDDTLMYGYLLQCSVGKNPQQRSTASLSFTVHIIDSMTVRVDTGTDKTTDAGNGYTDVDLSGSHKAISMGQDELSIAQYNLRTVKESEGVGGLLARTAQYIQGALDKKREQADAILSTVQSYGDFLYGRTLVIPAGAAYDEHYKGNPQFAGGSELYEALQKGEVITIDLPAMLPDAGGYQSGSYTDNLDEYPLVLSSASGGRAGDYNTDYVVPFQTNTDLAIIAARLGEEYGVDPSDLLTSSISVGNGDNITAYSAFKAQKWKSTPLITRKLGFVAFNVASNALSNITRNTMSEQGKSSLLATHEANAALYRATNG